VPEAKFNELNYTFTINVSDQTSKDLRNEFKDTLSLIDNKLINYYFDLKINKTINYILKLNDWEIGYGLIAEDDEYWNLYEIYLKEEFRQLGLGTKLFEYIKNDSKKNNKKVRTYTLPSDRRAKNFYESNRITARVLIMEEKRENSRYRP
tara:strand:+ start:782 stop:1231 length:450 start_codon:yes stop_codon:yes gene_type:complete